MKKIIGIHGLANKPPEADLTLWWKSALDEGLKNRGVAHPNLPFRMVYWADLLYKNPLHIDPRFTFDKLYNDEPYIAATANTLKTYKDSWHDDLRAAVLDIGGSGIDFLKQHFGMDALADWLLDKLAKDLAFYYDDGRMLQNQTGQQEQASTLLKDRLKSVLREEKGNEIMLIAHSMGSIIAYDVLRDLGRSGKNIQVSNFVTIGSPLGLPHVKGKIVEQRGYDPEVRTPSIVTKSWINFADRKDPVAVDIYLHNDYEKNSSRVRVVDDLVKNDYHTQDKDGKPKHNHHKSYGYLRTPELSDHVKQFLGL